MTAMELANIANIQRAFGVTFNNHIDDPAKDNDLDVVNDSGGFGPGTGNGGGDIIYRTREGVERFMITDINNPAASAQAQSEVPIMMDSVTTEAANYNHVPGGGNVLYMDGHVSFIRYPGEYPISKEAAEYIALFSF